MAYVFLRFLTDVPKSSSGEIVAIDDPISIMCEYSPPHTFSKTEVVYLVTQTFENLVK